MQTENMLMTNLRINRDESNIIIKEKEIKMMFSTSFCLESIRNIRNFHSRKSFKQCMK